MRYMSRSFGRKFGILIVICSLPISSVFASDDWPMIQHDSSHTGNNSETVLIPPLVMKWVFESPGCLFDSFSSAEGTVFAGGMDPSDRNILVAVDASSGEKKWEFVLETGRGAMDCVPAIWNDLVYFGGQSDDKLYALHVENGQKAWEFPGMEDMYTSSPAVVDGVVYALGNNGKLHALSASTGKEKWEFSTESRCQCSPSVAGDIIYVGFYDGSLFAIDAEIGTVKWSQPNCSGVFSCPLVSNGIVYDTVFKAEDEECNTVKALDADTGSLQWEATLEGGLSGGLALYNDTLYVKGWSRSKSKMYALNASNGSEKWSFNIEGEGVGAIAIGNGIVYVCGLKSKILYALDANTGTEKWRYQFDGWLDGIIIADNALYVALNSKLYKFISATSTLIEVADTKTTEGYMLFSQGKYSEARSQFEVAEKTYVEIDNKEKAAEMQRMIDKCNDYITRDVEISQVSSTPVSMPIAPRSLGDNPLLLTIMVCAAMITIYEFIRRRLKSHQ